MANRSLKSRIRFALAPLFRVAFILTIIVFTFDGFWALRTVFAACDISGTVYQDYNADGTRDALEPGQAGIEVTVYETTVTAPGVPAPPLASLIVGTATTDANGDYSIVGVPTTGQVRVEFTEIPDYLRSGRFGTGVNGSATTATFVDCVGVQANVNLAVNSPGEYCSLANPQLGTSCYVIDDQQVAPASAEPSFYAFPFAASGDPNPANPRTTMARAEQIGTTWGLGYHRASDSFLVGSFVKRYAGLGPNAAGTGTTSGGIYRISPASATNPALVSVSMFIDLGATTGANTHPTSTTSCFPGGVPVPGRRTDCWLYDSDTFPVVGKMGLGDIDISPDDRSMFVVNLLTRQLIEIPIVMQATGPVPGSQRTYSLVNLPGLTTPGTACASGDYRPFGLGTYQGRLFVGGVCSAETSGLRTDLRAYVHSFDPLNPGLGFRLDFTFALDYPRRCTDSSPGCPAIVAADWQPWSNVWPPNNGPVVVHPEPWLTDIEFDSTGAMILGFRDRWGDRTGNMRPPPFALGDDTLYLGIAAGDMLRACPNGAGGWILEDNATCGGIPTGGANNTQGPDTRIPPAQVGGEYYFNDENNPPAPVHDEILLGGLVDIPGSPIVASTAFDPLPPSGGDDGLFDGGIVWFDNANGDRVRQYRLFNGGFGPAPGRFNFGKSNGLGDLEAVCGPPPLEIGNRVWEDLDQNGMQDPGEVPLAGVVLNLYMISDSFGRPVNQLVGQTATNADGEYYFNETTVPIGGLLNGNPVVPIPYVNYADANNNGVHEVNLEPTGVMPNATYEIRLDDPNNYGVAGVLSPYYITPNDTIVFRDTNDNSRDSDGRNPTPLILVSDTNFPSVRLRTANYGENDHTFDFGFALLPPPAPGVPAVQSGGSITVTKTVNPPFAQPGDIVTWTIIITNTSSVPISPVIIDDPLPATLDILTSQITVSSASAVVTVNGQVVNFNQPTMAAGEVVTIIVPTRIRAATGVPFIIVNEIPGFGDSARAQVVSASNLPNTGQSVWGQARTPLLAALIMAVTLLLVTVLWRRLRTLD